MVMKQTEIFLRFFLNSHLDKYGRIDVNKPAVKDCLAEKQLIFLKTESMTNFCNELNDIHFVFSD